MHSTPRTKINLTYREVFSFILSLFKKPSKNDANGIIKDFEVRYGKMFGYPQAVSFSKARGAFYYLLKNLDLKPKGEVIISAIHVADFVNIIRCAGFKPVVVDLDPNTYCIDYECLEKKINKYTTLIFITHLSGFVPNMDRIVALSQKWKIPIIEDCSQAVSSFYQGKPLGSFGKAAIFSLSMLKPVSTLFGGIVLTKDQVLLEKLRSVQQESSESSKIHLLMEAFKNLIFKIATQNPFFSFFVFPILRLFASTIDFLSRYQRHNKSAFLRKNIPDHFLERLTWQQAKLGLEQLTTVGNREEKRICNGKYYYHNIKGSSLIKKPKILDIDSCSFWLFPLYVHDAFKVKKYLSKHSIDSSGYLLSNLAEEPAFKSLNFKAPNAKKIKENTLFIPLFDTLSQNRINYIVNVINNYTIK